MSMGKTQGIVYQIRNKYIGMSVPVKAAWDKYDNYSDFYEDIINR